MRRFWVRPWTARRVSAWAGLLLCVTAAWRLQRYLLDFPLWGDEARVAVNFFDRDLAGLAEPLDYCQIVPLFFLWAESLVSDLLGLGEMALRLLPVAAGVGSIFVFYRLARASLDRRSALAGVALFAASYYPVRHATEIKPYSVDLLCGVILMLLGLRLVSGRGGLAGFLAASVSFVWCSYPSVFVAGGVLAVLVSQRRSLREAGPVLAAGAVLSLSFAAMYATVGRAQADAGAFLLESRHWTFPPVAEPWRLPLWALDAHTGNLFAYPNGGNNHGSSATFLLFLAGCVALWRSGRRRLLFLLLSPFALMFVAAAMRKYPYGGTARVAQHAVPSICLLCGAGVVGAARALAGARRTGLVLRAWILLMLVFAVGGMVRDIAKPHKHPSDSLARRAVTRLGVEKRPGDRWIVFGRLDRSAHAPTLPRLPGVDGWGGSWARLHYYILRNAPPDLAWAPVPGGVEPGPRTLLLSYRDNQFPFPEEQFAQYLARLEERLGPAGERDRIFLRAPKPDRQREAIDIRRFR